MRVLCSCALVALCVCVGLCMFIVVTCVVVCSVVPVLRDRSLFLAL